MMGFREHNWVISIWFTLTATMAGHKAFLDELSNALELTNT